MNSMEGLRSHRRIHMSRHAWLSMDSEEDVLSKLRDDGGRADHLGQHGITTILMYLCPRQS